MKGTQFITNISSIISGFWNGNEMIKKWIILFLITGPCTTNSGGCQELCYPLANAQYSCGCSSGYTLNGVACESSELREGRATQSFDQSQVIFNHIAPLSTNHGKGCICASERKIMIGLIGISEVVWYWSKASVLSVLCRLSRVTCSCVVVRS